jgi:hypothetical protein
MQIFLVERTISIHFNPSDADQAALHSRWATDAYNKVGAMWYGTVVAGGKMYGLVAADDATVFDRYCAILGIDALDIVVRPVDQFLGPAVAMLQGDPRFRPLALPPKNN